MNLKNLPLAISGLMLATLSLAKLFDSIRYLLILIGCVILLLIILKAIKYPEIVKGELNTVIGLSSIGTFSMSLMLLASYLNIVSLWILGIILHLALICVFTKRYVIDKFEMENVYASWWIVYIGITMAAITAPAFNLQNYGYIFFSIGFVMMIPTLALVSYRYIKFKQIDDKAKPLICIYTALFSILLVGYVNAYDINETFIKAIYMIAIIFYIFSFYKFTTFWNLKFSPTFSAFSFPFVISAIATRNMYNIFSYDWLYFISNLETVIALVMVIYVYKCFVEGIKW